MQSGPFTTSGQVALDSVESRPWRRPRKTSEWKNWPLYFTWYGIICQVSLLVLGDTPLRLPLRIATYGGSLVLLVFWPPRFQTHPALKFLKWVPVILVIGLLHPDRNTLAAGVGQIALYISIFAPLAWVAGCPPTRGIFTKVITALWLFNLASAATGVLQVYFPGHFQGATSMIVGQTETFQQGAMTVVLADGTRILRPFGLTDTPGGAGAGGLNAIVLGAGVFLTTRRWWVKLAAVGGVLIGLFAIFLSQMRVDLSMAVVCGGVLLVVLVMRGEVRRAGSIGIVLGACLLAAATWAFAVGGQQTIDRFDTLMAADPASVYGANRGYFMHELIHTDLPKYPFGAGLGRWGMMNFYFGNQNDPLYSEIMWTAWLYDGGVPLMALYLGSFGAALWFSWKLTARRRDALGLWAGVVFAFNIAGLAGTFVFPLFIVQAGLEFWLINACLFSAYLAAEGQTEPAHNQIPAAA